MSEERGNERTTNESERVNSFLCVRGNVVSHASLVQSLSAFFSSSLLVRSFPNGSFLNLLAFIVRSSLSFDRQCQFCSLGKGGKTAERICLSHAKKGEKGTSLPISSIFFLQFFNGHLGLTDLTPLRLNVPRDVKDSSTLSNDDDDFLFRMLSTVKFNVTFLGYADIFQRTRWFP